MNFLEMLLDSLAEGNDVLFAIHDYLLDEGRQEDVDWLGRFRFQSIHDMIDRQFRYDKKGANQWKGFTDNMFWVQYREDTQSNWGAYSDKTTTLEGARGLLAQIIRPRLLQRTTFISNESESSASSS